MRRNSFFFNNESLHLRDQFKENMNILKDKIIFEIKNLFNQNKLEIDEIKKSIEKLDNKIGNNFKSNYDFYNYNNNKISKEINFSCTNDNDNFIQTEINSIHNENNKSIQNINKFFIPESEFIIDKSTNELTINKFELINYSNKASKKINITIKNSGKIKWPDNYKIINKDNNDLFKVNCELKKELEPEEELQIETKIFFLNVNDLKPQKYELNLIAVDKDNQKIGNGNLIIFLNIITNKNIDSTESESKNINNWKSSTIKNQNKSINFDNEIRYNNNDYFINNYNDNDNNYYNENDNYNNNEKENYNNWAQSPIPNPQSPISFIFPLFYFYKLSNK